MKNKTSTIDELLRKKLSEAAGPMPDPDSLWAQFEAQLNAPPPDGSSGPSGSEPLASPTGAEPALPGPSLFFGPMSWMAAAAVGAVIAAVSLAFSEKTADLIEKIARKSEPAVRIEAPGAIEKSSKALLLDVSKSENSSPAANQASVGFLETRASESVLKNAARRPDLNTKEPMLLEKAAALPPGAELPKSEQNQAAPPAAKKPQASLVPNGEKPALEKPSFAVFEKPFDAPVHFERTDRVAEMPAVWAEQKEAALIAKTIEKTEEKGVLAVRPLEPRNAGTFRLATAEASVGPFSKALYPPPALPKGKKQWMGFLGADLSGSETRYGGAIAGKNFMNWGVGFRAPIKQSLWHWRAEGWASQIKIPRITIVKSTRSNLDSDRTLSVDSLTLYRMAGATLALQAERRLPLGFSLVGGPQFGYYPMVTAREERIDETSVTSSVQALSITFGDPKGLKTPAELNKWQIALRIGVEKALWERAVVGFAVAQNLLDLTPSKAVASTLTEGSGSNVYNAQTNFIAYAGYRF